MCERHVAVQVVPGDQVQQPNHGGEDRLSEGRDGRGAQQSGDVQGRFRFDKKKKKKHKYYPDSSQALFIRVGSDLDILFLGEERGLCSFLQDVASEGQSSIWSSFVSP